MGPDAERVGQDDLYQKEWEGFQLFMGENDNDGVLEPGEGAHVRRLPRGRLDRRDPGNLSWCPTGRPMASIPPLFTDFTYDNLGVPKSEQPSLTGCSPVDLGGFGSSSLDDADENGKFKVMTLRNIGLHRALCPQRLLQDPQGHHPLLQHP